MPARFSGMLVSWESGLLALGHAGPVGVVTSTYPARRAAELPPVEALALRDVTMKFAILREIVREAAYGLYHHRFRAALSMLGISWGIISVVVLLAYGDGFRGALDAGFKGAYLRRDRHRVSRARRACRPAANGPASASA